MKLTTDLHATMHDFKQESILVLAPNFIPAGVTLGTGTLLEPHVIFQRIAAEPCDAILGERVRVGAGALIGRGVRVGTGAIIRPATVVLQDIPDNAIVTGNPARIIGYTQYFENDASSNISGLSSDRPSMKVGVGGVTLHQMKLVKDLRGDLSVGEVEKDIPFPIKRYFLVFNVPSEKTRGEHAHYGCHQFLVCVKGQCSVVVDDGSNRREIELNAPNIGLHLPPLTWGIQYKYSDDAVLLVFASHEYEAGDYIRSYSEFKTVVGGS